MQDKYLNPFTDFGFKKLFGEEPNKDLLISFLNSFLPERHNIHDLQYTKHEYQGYTALDRKAIFDLNCVSSSGERFIVELQKAKQNYFKDRSLYYATFPIQEQAQRGDPQERQAYEDSLKYYRDLKNVTDTAFEDGVEQGIDIGVEKGILIGLEQGKSEGERAKAVEIARNLLDVLDDATIAQKTGLSVADIQQLRRV